MILSKRYQCIFLANPKCASMTIARILKHHYEGRVFDGEGPYDRVNTHHGINVPEALVPYYLIFSVVRNPYARHVSLYRHIQRTNINRYHTRVKDMTFDEFVPFFAMVTSGRMVPDEFNQTDFIYGKDRWLEGKVHLMHLESLQEDFARLPLPSAETITLPTVNASASYDWRDYYTNPSTVEQVYAWAEPDFTMFGYSREIPCKA